MGYPNVMKEIGTATVGLPLIALSVDRAIGAFLPARTALPDGWVIAGVAAACAGALLMAWSGYLLWSVGGISLRVALIWRGDTSRPRRLVTTGPYAATRNPFVIGDALILAGMGMALGSLPLLAMTVGWVAYCHRKIVMYEESNMTFRFGDAYEDYRARVGRWAPRLPRRVPAPIAAAR